MVRCQLGKLSDNVARFSESTACVLLRDLVPLRETGQEHGLVTSSATVPETEKAQRLLPLGFLIQSG
ncbi:hypothetical protein C2E31_12050 [Rhodopirellula baltica]|nr:hypothetical protein C2E31_12050 [Rhodopirellula baltica]